MLQSQPHLAQKAICPKTTPKQKSPQPRSLRGSTKVADVPPRANYKVAQHDFTSIINRMSNTDTIFAKIVRKEIPSKMVYQDDLVTAFHDISPVAPVHILIVPNKIIPTLNDASDTDEALLGKMVNVARKLAQEFGVAQSGYRLIMNTNGDGGQEVFHIHLHLIGGRKLGRMVKAAE